MTEQERPSITRWGHAVQDRRMLYYEDASWAAAIDRAAKHFRRSRPVKWCKSALSC